MSKTRHPIRNLLVPILIVASALSAYDYYNDREVTWHLRVIESVQRGMSNLQMFQRVPQEAPFIVEQSRPLEAAPNYRGPETREFPNTTDRQRFELVGYVSEVIDGDSFTARVHDNEFTIRLYGIDTPEYDQPHGSEASRALTQKLSRQTVAVELEDVDSYGRLVGTVYVDGENINEDMIAEGHAWWYRQ